MVLNLTNSFAALAVALGAWSVQAAQMTLPRGSEPLSQSRLNSVARLAAGLPSQHPFTQSATWKEHSTFMRAAWGRLESRQVAAMTAWRDTELGRTCPAGRTLMYPFSGPDFLNAHWLFPGCETIVMFGLEHIGEVPDVNAMNARALTQLAADVRVAMSNFVERNYFITESMAKQLRTSQLRGVVPVVMLSMALSGIEIVRIAPHDLAPLATAGPPPEGQPMRQLKGVTIEYLVAGSTTTRRLHYFSVDAADKGLSYHPEFLAYLRGLGPTTTFIKSASYLLQSGQFRQMRDTLLEMSAFVVQDDTGLPYALLQQDGWQVQLHGRYDKPIPPFGGAFQLALSRAYKTHEPALLPFTFGYQYHDFRDTRSNLIVAQRPASGTRRVSR